MRGKNINKAVFLLILLTGVCVCIFRFSAQCVEGIREGLKLCAATVIPSLFPFLIVSQFTVESGISDFIGAVLRRPTKLIFGLSGVCSSVIFMSLIGGFPVGARMTAQLLEDGRISRHEAQRLNLFCVNAGPAFIIGTVGSLMLSSVRAGVLLYTSVCLSSVITGILSRLLPVHTDGKKAESSIVVLKEPVSAFSRSVSGSLYSMLSICAWVAVFSAAISIIQSLRHSTGTAALCCILEVTNAAKLSARLFPLPVTAAVLSFGGISVHCQIYSYVEKSGLKLRLFLASRTISAALSALICKGLMLIVPYEASAFSNYSEVIADAYSVSLPSAAALIIMCALLIFEVDTNRKMC